MSSLKWFMKQNPDKYLDAGYGWNPQTYSCAVKKGDPDWLKFIDTTWNVAMFGHQNEIFDKAFFDYFGLKPPTREPGFPKI